MYLILRTVTETVVKDLNERHSALESTNANLQSDNDAKNSLIARLEQDVEKATKNQERLNTALHEVRHILTIQSKFYHW